MRTVLSPTHTVPRFCAAGSTLIAPTVPSAVTPSDSRSTTGPPAVPSSPTAVPPGEDTRQGMRPWYTLRACGVKANVQRSVSLPRSMPAGGCTLNTGASLAGSAHSKSTGMREVLCRATSRRVTAPTHVGLKYTAPDASSLTRGVYPAPLSRSSSACAAELLSRHTSLSE